MTHPKDDMVLRPDPKGKGGRARTSQDRQDRRRLRMQRQRALKSAKHRLERRLKRAAGVVALRSGLKGRLPSLTSLGRGTLIGLAVTIAARLVTGRSYEAQEELINKLIFGEQFQRAAGSARARAEVASDPLGATFGTGGGNQQLYEALRKIRTDEELARQALVTDVEGWGRFDVQGPADVMVMTFWKKLGGEAAAKALAEWAMTLRERQVFPDHPMRYDR